MEFPWTKPHERRGYPVLIESTGERIAKLRIAACLTQAELATKVNIRQNTVSQWESGKRTPSSTKLECLASTLGCSVLDLLTQNHENEMPPEIKFSEADLCFLAEAIWEHLQDYLNCVTISDTKDK